MKTENALEETYPSVDLAYEISKDSYNVSMKRFDEANDGFEKLRTWTTTMTLAFLAWMIPKAPSGSFDILFFIGLFIFLLILYFTAYGKSFGAVMMPSPQNLYDTRLHQDTWTFKKDFIFLAAQDFDKNAKYVLMKKSISVFIFLLFLLESISFGFWILLWTPKTL